MISRTHIFSIHLSYNTIIMGTEKSTVLGKPKYIEMIARFFFLISKGSEWTSWTENYLANICRYFLASSK